MNNAQRDWDVAIQEEGRSGSVVYREPAGSISLSWEFGGGDVVAIIYFENEATWNQRYPWTIGRRSEILQRIAVEVVRQKSPTSRAEIDERSGWINLHQQTPGSPPPVINPHQAFRDRKAKLTMYLALVLLLLAGAAIGLKTLFSVKTIGTPLANSIRTPQHIATLIQTLEPYVPSLHRDPAKDRYRLGLFLFPIDGSSAGRFIPISKDHRATDFQLAKILGCDGTTVWISQNRIVGVNLKTEKVVSKDHLLRANPTVAEPWNDYRRFSFDQRLRVSSEDRQRLYEVVPETLQAAPIPPPRNPKRLPFDAELQDFLTTGVRPTPTEWLGLHSAKDAAGEYKPGSRLWQLNRAESKKEMRRFHRAQLGPEQEQGRREILSLEPLGTEEYFNAAFVRTGVETEPIRFSGSEGFLMIYTASPALGATLMVARVSPDGKVVWKTDTGLDRFLLKQILPDTRYPAFVGTRPPIPDKVSEPLLVIIDTQTGKASTSSLWK